MLRVLRSGSGDGRRTLVCFAAAVASACRGVVDPPLPTGAARLTPPAVYRRWWAQVEACAGRAGAPAAVRWYAVPGVASVRGADGRELSGYFSISRNAIVLAGPYVRSGKVVRHEMLHAALGQPGHPPAYFQGRCAGWVDCPTIGCADEGVPPAAAPANAPVVAASALAITVEVLPPVVHRAPGDSGATVVVRATNTRAEPVWVQMTPDPMCPRCPDYRGFSYSLGGLGEERPTRPGAGGRFALPAGGAKLDVFDADLSRLPVGVYQVGGTFDWDSSRVRVSLRVEP